MNIINVEARTFEAMLSRFEAVAARIESLCRENGDKAMEQWLGNEDVCRLLDISPRTLQSYRDCGRIPFSRIGHKMYYKPADIARLKPLITALQKDKHKLKSA